MMASCTPLIRLFNGWFRVSKFTEGFEPSPDCSPNLLSRTSYTIGFGPLDIEVCWLKNYGKPLTEDTSGTAPNVTPLGRVYPFSTEPYEK